MVRVTQAGEVEPRWTLFGEARSPSRKREGERHFRVVESWSGGDFCEGFPEVDPLGVLALFPPVEFGDWAVVSHDPGPHFAGLSFFVSDRYLLSRFIFALLRVLGRVEELFPNNPLRDGEFLLSQQQLLVTFGTELMLPGQVAMVGANGEGGSDSDVG